MKNLLAAVKSAVEQLEAQGMPKDLLPSPPEVYDWGLAPRWIQICATLIKYITFKKVDMMDRYAIMYKGSIFCKGGESKIGTALYFHEYMHKVQIADAGGWGTYICTYICKPFPVIKTQRSRWEWEAYAFDTVVGAWEAIVKSGYHKQADADRRLYDFVVRSWLTKWTDAGKQHFYAFPYFFMDRNYRENFNKITASTNPVRMRFPWKKPENYTEKENRLYQLAILTVVELQNSK